MTATDYTVIRYRRADGTWSGLHHIVDADARKLCTDRRITGAGWRTDVGNRVDCARCLETYQAATEPPAECGHPIGNVDFSSDDRYTYWRCTRCGAEG